MYSIDYCNGVFWDVVADSLEKAQGIADEGAAYTQCDIVIKDEQGEEVSRRRWWGVAYDPDTADEDDTEDTIIDFGDFGYYSNWE